MNEQIYYTTLMSDIGEILLAGCKSGLIRLHIEAGKGRDRFKPEQDWKENNDFFKGTVQQLNEYFAGDRRIFDLALAPEGTVFQKKVWDELVKIPYGRVKSYGEIATDLGNPKASRAVGMANGKNPLPIIIPCHRVIGSSGKLTGYAFGLDVKRRLLDLESGSLF